MNKKIFFLILSFFVSITLKSQSYLADDIIKIAENNLRETVGDYFFSYFKFDENSFYQYQDRKGNIKWARLKKGRQTKGKFLNAKQVVFIYKHPDFEYDYVNKRVYVHFDSILNLVEKIDIDRIPKFLLENKKSNWLNRTELNQIIDNQNLKKSARKINLRLEFDSRKKEYYWIVFNTIAIFDCYSDEEILHLDPVTGEILKHFEERQYLTNCN